MAYLMLVNPYGRSVMQLHGPEIDLSRAGMALAASVITLIPAVFVFFMGQDYLESGIAASGMKE